MPEETILVIDDEEKILEVICSYLEKAGYAVISALNGTDALKLFKKESPSLVILDLMLPDISGEDICRQIRTTSGVPVIMLTAKVDEEEKLTGFDAGADDYVTKPFSPRELMARVEAVLRRSKALLENEGEWKYVSNGEIMICDEEHRVIVRNTEIKLTPNEYNLLLTLADHPVRVFTREELVTLILGHDYEGYNRTIDTHIKTLRKKIEKTPEKPVYIITVHGIGYKFSRNSYAALP